MPVTDALRNEKLRSVRSGISFLGSIGLLSLLLSYNSVRLQSGYLLFLKSSIFSEDDQRTMTSLQTTSSFAPVDVSTVAMNVTARHRTTQFLSPSDIDNQGEYYSGMWWLSRESFLSIRFAGIFFLEQASFRVFNVHSKKIRLTRDWLDFSVEHLSKYVKLLMWQTESVIKEPLANILKEYVERTVYFDMQDFPNSVAASTIALLPFRTSRGDNQLLVLEMAATLASLWRVGIGRALVVGLSEDEERASKEAFALLQDKVMLHPMELAYVTFANATEQDRDLVPGAALRGLDKVMRQSLQNNRTDDTDDEIRAWLGSDPLRWKYVYFTEPDLLLHTRPDALMAVSNALQDGIVMAAHRLEPIPHYRNYPSAKNSTIKSKVDSKLIPDIGSFAAIHEVDPMLGHSCCDQGKFYPGNRETPHTFERVMKTGKCSDIWAHCGFGRRGKDYGNLAVVLEQHNRLLGYPLFTIKGGTGFPLVAASQRVCVPRQYLFDCPAM